MSLPRGSHGGFWTEERRNYLIAQAPHCTAQQIADHFKVTRNTVIGKANRLGLRIRCTGYNFTDNRRRVLERQRERNRARRQVPTPPTPPPAVAPPPYAVELLDLGPDCCHWPVAGSVAPYLFCGNATDRGEDYCPWHRGEAYQH